MRFFAPLIAAFAALAVAQTSNANNPNAISIPTGGLQISVGETTIKWTNPSSGTVTIKLQQGAGSTPASGYTLISGVPASDETATFNIPASVNSHEYFFEIISDQEPSLINYSTQFSISGATGTGLPSSSTVSPSSASTFSTMVTTSSTPPTSAASSSSTTSSSASAASSSASSSSSSNASSTSSSSPSSTSSETVPTSVTGGASLLGVNGGIAVLVAGAALVL